MERPPLLISLKSGQYFCPTHSFGCIRGPFPGSGGLDLQMPTSSQGFQLFEQPGEDEDWPLWFTALFA